MASEFGNRRVQIMTFWKGLNAREKLVCSCTPFDLILGRRIRHGRGHGRAAVGWFAYGLLLTLHAPKPSAEVRHGRDDE
jgi:hypothetical protein